MVVSSVLQYILHCGLIFFCFTAHLFCSFTVVSFISLWVCLDPNFYTYCRFYGWFWCLVSLFFYSVVFLFFFFLSVLIIISLVLVFMKFWGKGWVPQKGVLFGVFYAPLLGLFLRGFFSALPCPLF